MADSILLEGDLAAFSPSFGMATVLGALQFKLRATGSDPVYGRKMCVLGDERLVVVPSCSYITPQCPIPGSGTITILQLHPSSVALKTASLGKKVLLKGGPFTARFQVQVPAMMTMPTGQQVPDSIFMHMGTGSFVSTGATKQGE